MIRVQIFTEDDAPVGFEISGHSGSGEQGSDIVCAAVSSAAYLAANTITDVLFVKAEIDLDDDGYFRFLIRPDNTAQAILKGLQMHLEALAQEYPANVKVTINGGAKNA